MKSAIPNKVVSHAVMSPTLEALFSKAGIDTPTSQINQRWSELDGLYESIAEGIITSGTEINSSIALIKDLGTDHPNELVVLINGVKKDLEDFTKDLLTIHSRHRGKTGDITDPNELSLCLGIYNDYIILSDRFRAMIFPPMLEITEHITNAVSKIQALDKDAVTDVEFKEVQNG